MSGIGPITGLDRLATKWLAVGLLGHWRLGEVAGTVVADETGAHDGIYVGGPTLGVAGALAGDANTAVTLAAGQYVDLASQTWGFGTNRLTFMAWVKRADAGTARVAIIGNNNVANAPMWEITFASGGIPDGAMTVTNASGVFVVRTDGLIVPSGIWTHVAYTRNGPGNYHQFYVNGFPVTTTQASGGDFTDPTYVPTFGVRASGVEQWVGSLDEIRIWRRPLTAAEVFAVHAIDIGAA